MKEAEPSSLIEALDIRRVLVMIGVVENFEARLRCLDCGAQFQQFYSAAVHLDREHAGWVARLEAKYSRA